MNQSPVRLAFLLILPALASFALSQTRVEKFLNEKKAKTKDLSTLISWGFRLVEYHKKPEYQATLHASPK
jgi:hypothetical protein